MKKQRLANLELLRVISMVMIITMHLTNHSQMIYDPRLGKAEYALVWILFGCGFCSINLYILISSYFLCESRFSVSRLAKLAIQVFTYALGITLLYWIFTDVPHEKKHLAYSVLPILSDFYWFVSMYVGMYLLSPILNKLVHALTKRQLQCAIAVSLLLISVWPNLIYFSSAMNTAGGISISWFLTVYLLGAYIRMYYQPTGCFGKALLIGCAVNLIAPLTRFFMEFLLASPVGRIPFIGDMLDDMMWGYSFFYYYSSIPVTIASVLFFIAFLNIKIESKKLSAVINFFSGSSLAVYLIHDHLFVRESLWKWLCPTNWIGHWYLLPLIIASIVGIYLFGTLIEQVRLFVFKPVLNSRWLGRQCTKIDDKLRGWWN